MKKIIFIVSLVFLFVLSSKAQTVCPQGLICLTQAEANKAAENARLIPQLEAKIGVQEQALIEKDKSIKEVKDTANKNEADLKDRLQKTEVELANKTGQLISKEAELTRNLAIIDVLLKSTKKKCLPFSVCF